MTKALTPDQWFRALNPSLDEVAGRVGSGETAKAIPWAEEIRHEVMPSRSFMELGSGTAEISCYLASMDPCINEVILVDQSHEALDFAFRLFRRLGLEKVLRTFDFDVTSGMDGFPDKHVDCVWSSGLLEHFGPEKMYILENCARIARSRSFHLVPNAMSMAYMLGKWDQERRSIWKWGAEWPFRPSILRYYMEKFFHDVSIRSVADEHSFNFLRHDAALMEFVSSFVETRIVEGDSMEGYLLIGTGHVIDK